MAPEASGRAIPEKSPRKIILLALAAASIVIFLGAAELTLRVAAGLGFAELPPHDSRER
jgi:hypothetical protein